MGGGNGARSDKRARHAVRFVGIDGEGVRHADGSHRYVLLSVGSESLHRDGAPLEWRDVFEFLWDRFERDPHATYVGFFLKYDFTQWLKSLPEGPARELFEPAGIAGRRRRGEHRPPFPVRCGGWEFDLLGDKRFKLRRRGAPAWLYVCDVGSFFQCSLLKALDPKRWSDPVVSRVQFEIIRRGKERRDRARLDAEMTAYNVAENAALADLMSTYNGGLVEAGIRLTRMQWFGPGQAASKWLRTIGAPTGEEVRASVPADALLAARASYYGGWFELFCHGMIPGTTWEYDVNSAYPHALSLLPCLLHGRWSRGAGRRAPEGGLCLVRAQVRGSCGRVGAMLHRTSKGRVLRPRETNGWFWRHELNAARAAGVVDDVHVTEWHHYRPCGCPPPIGAIAHLYEMRLAAGKDSALGKALKLVYNSAYGKMAQSIGTPRYANPVYASLITAACRTRILEGIATHPTGVRDLVMVATDGVYFRTPHPTLTLSQNLGDWSHERRESLTTMLPGIYWDDAVRVRVARGEDPGLKSRGINAGDLARQIADVDALWDAWEPGAEWPSVHLRVAFAMVTCRQAVQRGDWQEAGHVSYDETRVATSDPLTKRDGSADGMTRIGGAWESRSYATPLDIGEGLESKPYSKHFGLELAELLGAELVTPDGTVADGLREALSSS